MFIVVGVRNVSVMKHKVVTMIAIIFVKMCNFMHILDKKEIKTEIWIAN